MKTKITDPKGEIEADVAEVKRAFSILNLSAMPIVREVLIIRKFLEFTINVMLRPRS
jgi:hypothetical protein